MADQTELDLSQEEAALFDAGGLFEEVLDRRRDLDMETQDAAETAFDLQTKGPLYRYVQMRREQARGAVAKLIDVDPTDAPGIAALQVEVREYITACNWIHTVIAYGDEADKIIEDEFSNKEPPADE